MSKKVLSEEQISLLSKGLNFVPTKKTPLTLLIAELQEWQRLMRLHEYWSDRDEESPNEASIGGSGDQQYKKSRWVPPRGRDPCLDLYLDEVMKDVINGVKRQCKGNLRRRK